MHCKSKVKKICIISDSFVPNPISSSGMIYNLAVNFESNDIDVLCIHSGDDPRSFKNKISKKFSNYNINNMDFITTSLLLSFRKKSHYHRFIFEIIISITLSIKCMLNYKKWRDIDLIIWYGPSSFLWIIVFSIKLFKKVPSYYILRDIFPDWLKNLKVVKSNLLLLFLEIFSYPQYLVSDVIGVESEFNKEYLKKKLNIPKKIEVLYNWPSLPFLNNIHKKHSDYLLDFLKHYSLKDRICCGLYTGNTSLAHDYYNNLNFLMKLKLKKSLKKKLAIHFFGQSDNNFKDLYSATNLNEIGYFDWNYIPDYELPEVIKKVDFGIVTLNRNNYTQNIPGKFVSYTQVGLPILCFANINSSLSKLINKYNCGVVIDRSLDIKKNIKLIEKFFCQIRKDTKFYKIRSQKLFVKYFDTNKVTDQILNFTKNNDIN
jgi:hypothetical protein